MAVDVVNNVDVAELQRLVTSQPAEEADVIVWLQGNEYDRGEKVLELYSSGAAPIIFVTGNNVNKIDIGTVTIDDMVKWLNSNGVDSGNIVVDDQSMNTRDQAKSIANNALKANWKSVILVASTHHQLRAFLTLLHQASIVGWHGKITNQPKHHDWDEVPSGRTMSSGEAYKEELVKIEKYSDDLASIEEGIRYFKT